jgi:pyruvate formate lyase activating enzyme
MLINFTSPLVAFRKTSLVDYPGKVAAVIFFQGCNLRCPWCYNGELVLGTAEGLTPLDEALRHIEKRKNVLGGVVLSGGEPALQKNLAEIIKRLKGLGLLLKLDTNGAFPAILKRLLEMPETRPDFIAMDIKAPFERYGELCSAGSGAENLAEKLAASAALIKASGIPHEFRSLKLPDGVLSEGDWQAMREAAGEPLKIREFHAGSCLDETWNAYGGA